MSQESEPESIVADCEGVFADLLSLERDRLHQDLLAYFEPATRLLTEAAMAAFFRLFARGRLGGVPSQARSP